MLECAWRGASQRNYKWYVELVFVSFLFCVLSFPFLPSRISFFMMKYESEAVYDTHWLNAHQNSIYIYIPDQKAPPFQFLFRLFIMTFCFKREMTNLYKWLQTWRLNRKEEKVTEWKGGNISCSSPNEAFPFLVH